MNKMFFFFPIKTPDIKEHNDTKQTYVFINKKSYK